MEKREYLRGIVPDYYIDRVPPPLIEFPLHPQEIEDFPRHVGPVFGATLRNSFRKRRRFYRDPLIQISANTRRPGHGQYVIILVPKTFERILRQIELLPGHKREEVVETLEQLYYWGRRLDEAEAVVSSKTISRYLHSAERVLGILAERRSRPLKISLKAITLSYKVLRYGRDAWLDVQKYFPDRIF